MTKVETFSYLRPTPTEKHPPALPLTLLTALLETFHTAPPARRVVATGTRTGPERRIFLR